MAEETIEEQLRKLNVQISDANNTLKKDEHKLDELLKQKAELEYVHLSKKSIDYTGKWVHLMVPSNPAKQPCFMYVEKDNGIERRQYNLRYNYGHSLTGTIYRLTEGEYVQGIEVQKNASMFWTGIIEEIDKTEVLNSWNSLVGDLTHLINTLGGA
jgi:hypothetical protein